MTELQKKPRWSIAVIVALHLLALWLIVGQKITLRIGKPGGAMQVTSLDGMEIAGPAPSRAGPGLPNFRFQLPAPLTPEAVEVPGVELGPAVRHDAAAVHTGVRGNGKAQANEPASPAQAANGANGATGAGAGSEGIGTLSAGQVRYLVPPRPFYPPGAANANEAGTAKVRILFERDGKAMDAVLLASTGFTSLDEAAIEGALRAVLAPIPGRQARVYVTQDIVFIVP
jgi:periplasmic protein TonB